MQGTTRCGGKVYGYRKYEESYRVIDCPLYLEDRREPERKTWDGPYWDAPVCMECYSLEICMRTKSTCNRRAKC